MALCLPAALPQTDPRAKVVLARPEIRGDAQKVNLPIDPFLPEVVEALRMHPLVCLEAPPGTGKTTRVPPALWRAFPQGKILVLEPRRLAARWSSQRVAQELGMVWGQEVGYQVRFEDRTSAATRLIYLTQGIFSRRLLHDPQLRGVAVVVLDEFHERNLDNDLALAWLRRLGRSGPAVLIMSATLPSNLSAHLGGSPTLVCPAPMFPVEISFVTPRGTLEQSVKEAVDKHSPRGPGEHTLVFLPGMREIRACQRELTVLAERRRADILVLHGSLPANEQDRALQECPQGNRWILATNVAETSLTIPGVTCVVDSGLARRHDHRPGRAAHILEVARIPQFSARQRSGRAGRTGPGRCVRLFSEADFLNRPQADVPEILRTDLAELGLFLARLGVAPRDLDWLDSPSPERWECALRLLHDLGALSQGHLTELGGHMADLPLHPRLSRFLLKAPGRRAVALAVAVSEGLLVDPDVLAAIPMEVEAWLAHGAQSALRRGVESLLRHFPLSQGKQSDSQLSGALLGSYFDRVGRIRRGRDLLLADGTSLRLPTDIPGDPWVLGLQLQDQWAAGSPSAQMSAYACIEPEQLLERPELNEEIRMEWRAEDGSVQALSQLRYGQLVLEESRRRAAPGPETARLLLQGALDSAWWRELQEKFDNFTARCLAAGLTAPDRHDWLAAACAERTCLRQLEELKEPGQSLPRAQRYQLERCCPAFIQLNRRRYAIHYEVDKPPWVAAPLVEFFNMRQGPVLGEGQPLTLHILAPNRRPVQITNDLAGFWLRHYPKIRQQLCRRYPRHPWPEDPLQASLDWKPAKG